MVKTSAKSMTITTYVPTQLGRSRYINKLIVFIVLTSKGLEKDIQVFKSKTKFSLADSIGQIDTGVERDSLT